MKSAYIYAIVVDGVVRYIGKGTRDRLHDHMRRVRSIARRRAAGEVIKVSYFQNKLTKAWLDGSEIDAVILIDGLTHEQAYTQEIAEIAARKSLWNVSAGGSGLRGFVRSPSHRQKVSQSNKLAWSDPVLLAEHSARCKVVLLRPEVKAKIKQPKAPEHNAKVAERARARWADPAFREKMHGVFSSQEYKQRRSEATKRGWQTRRQTVK
jgi:hypothetical protein